MKALVLDAYNSDLDKAIRSLKVGVRPLPKLTPGQVLVKVEAAPCNPSDLLFLQKRYGVVKTLPTVPGWEGAGTVVAAGSLLGKWLVGRRVAVGGQGDQDGTWAEYVVAGALSGCLPLIKELDTEQGATLLVNPLTAVGLLDEAKKRGARAVMQTAAASQAGRMLISLAQDIGMPLVNIVRRPEQVDLLHGLGAENVLNSSASDFQQQLVDIVTKLQVTVAFDAVAGAITGQLLSAMPKGATVLVYGALSQNQCSGIDPIGLIFSDKRVGGFFLGQWIREQGPINLLRQSNRVQRLIASGQLQTNVQMRVGLDEAGEALLHYKDNMTAGKILIKPGL
jgi:NADPH:quinone reductase-like Zn-dependent oxidoreductase